MKRADDVAYPLRMAKVSEDPLSADDLQQFVDNDSDFGFEMQVLRALRIEGFWCEHSGTYQDPVTQKIRQFDIRASKELGDVALSLAVECKNIKPNSPILLSAIPRTIAESFHDVLVYNSKARNLALNVREVKEKASAYKPEDMVAKKTDQVAWDGKKFASNDSLTFEKLNQAVNSCHGLLKSYLQTAPVTTSRVIVPILVVPDARLWQVDYNSSGEVQAKARPVTKSTLFLNHTWGAPNPYFQGEVRYRISHTEIITIGVLKKWTDLALSSHGFFPGV